MASPSAAEMIENELLAKLNVEDRQRLAAHMTVLELERNNVLQSAGEDVLDTWFPCGSALASFHLWADVDADAVEVALVGREGAVGGIVSNGRLPAYANAVVRVGGPFFRIRTSALEQAKLESISIRHWFARYSDCLIAQVFQTSACNATHTIVQRTAKWLLTAMVRTRQSEFEMTQEQLAEMLGVGRTFVTRIVRQLRNEKVIATRRGVLTVLDKEALEQKSCQCGVLIKDHFDVVLNNIYTHNRRS